LKLPQTQSAFAEVEAWTQRFLQHVSIACYDKHCISYRILFDRPSVWPSVCHTLVSCQNDSSCDHAVFTGDGLM